MVRNRAIARAFRDGLLEDAAARLNTEMIEHPRARARVLNVLGDVHLARAEGLQARQRHQEALDLAIRHGLSEASDRSRAGLAAVGIFSGDYAWTEVLLRDLLTERLERFGADSPKVAAIPPAAGRPAAQPGLLPPGPGRGRTRPSKRALLRLVSPGCGNDKP